MRENARTRLAALREKKPPTKVAQIRKLWPEIKAAIDDGHSLKSISDCLAADGVVVSTRELSSYVGRLRKKSIDTAAPAPRDLAAAFQSAISPAAEKSPQPANPDEQGARDPLANVRERQKKPSGFDYRPELADPKELI